MLQHIQAYASQKSLSKRETEVIALLFNRVTYTQELADKLQVSQNTLNNHFKKIFRKAKVVSKAELITDFLAYLREQNLILGLSSQENSTRATAN